MTDGTWFPHPDLIQTTSIQATQGTRRYVFGGACYLLYARVSGINGAVGLSVEMFTTEDPDAEDADTDKCSLSQDSYRGHDDAPDIYFPNGLYFKVDGATAGNECLVEMAWVSRKDYCRAYAKPQSVLQKCWDLACGREGDAWLENFDEGDLDDGAWDNDGASTGSGGAEFGKFLDNIFRIQDDGDDTKEIAFQASAITSGQTRTIQMADRDVDLSDSGLSTALIRAWPIPTNSTMRAGTSVTDATLSASLVKAGTLLNIRTETGSYNVAITDQVILCDATAFGITMNLPAAVAAAGLVLYFKKVDATTNTVTLDGSGSETIDGNLTVSTATQYDAFSILSDGSNWHIL